LVDFMAKNKKKSRRPRIFAATSRIMNPSYFRCQVCVCLLRMEGHPSGTTSKSRIAN
jgi:hypothetical protein